MRYVAAQYNIQPRGVVGEDLRILCRATHRDIDHALVKQILVRIFAVHVDQNPTGGLALAGVTGHSVAVIDVALFLFVDFDLATRVEPDRDCPVPADLSNMAEFPACYFLLIIRRSELHTLALCKFPPGLAIDLHTVVPCRVVMDALTVFALDGELVGHCVLMYHAYILSHPECRAFLRRSE